MREENSGSKRPVAELIAQEGRVSLPFSLDEFSSFLQGLLGRPQEISRVIEGRFEIDTDSIRDLHALLGQRIQQQNRGQLISFEARLVFDDRSSVTLRSIEELITYNETRPVASEGLHLTWDYLLKFEDREHPEKQRIELSIQASEAGNPIISGVSAGPAAEPTEEDSEGSVAPYFAYTISHTARTWATDIDTLLSNHIHSQLLPRSRVRSFITKYRKTIARLAGLFVILFGSMGIMLGLESDVHNDLPLLSEHFGDREAADAITLDERVEYLVYLEESRIADHDHTPLWALTLGMFLLTTISISLRFLIAELADLRERSYILLTAATEKQRAEISKGLRRRHLVFWLSVLLSLATGLGANWIYGLIT